MFSPKPAKSPEFPRRALRHVVIWATQLRFDGARRRGTAAVLGNAEADRAQELPEEDWEVASAWERIVPVRAEGLGARAGWSEYAGWSEGTDVTPADRSLERPSARGVWARWSSAVRRRFQAAREKLSRRSR